MNILLLICDDLTPRLGCYGDSVALTPCLDQLANRGVTFKNHYTTCPLCTPARASLFTGLFPHQHGITTLKGGLRDRIPDAITWPQLLKEKGYHTFRSGKVYHKGVPDCLVGLGDGGDDPYSWSEKFNPGGYELHSNGMYKNLTPWETHTAGAGGAIAWLKAEKGDAKQHDWRAATDVIESIRKHDRSQPALWAAGFIRPHVPMVVPREYFEMYDDVEINLPEVPENKTSLSKAHGSTWASNFNISNEDRKEAIKAYYASISFIDAQVGRILEVLKEQHLEDETLVIFTSDHGFQLGEHGLWFKNYLYRESVQVPLIIADPTSTNGHGGVTESFSVHEDIFSTVTQWTGIDPPASENSRSEFSMLPVIQNPSTVSRDHVTAIVDYGDTIGKSVRTKDHLFIQWSGEISEEELYDLKTDPGEHQNLLQSNTPHRHTRDKLSSLLINP